jgi:hypothetical protein
MSGHLAIGIKKALLWHTIEVRTRSHVESLSCLGEEAASRLANDLHRFINRYLLELIGSDQEALKEVDAKLEPLIEGKRQYLAQADLAQAIASVSGPAAAALSHPLFDADGIGASLIDHGDWRWIMCKKSGQTLAQKLRPLLTPDFDQFDDEELEIVVGIMMDTLAKEERKIGEQVPVNPNL